MSSVINLKNKNIVLTGPMGSGKSIIGKLLAKKLNYTFIDTDDLIESNEDISINEIFNKKGESYFRKLENNICKELSSKKNLVIATGGGIVLNPENIKYLRKNGIIVNLKSSVDTLWNRIKNSSNRPLLKVENPFEKLKKIVEEREEFYNNADIFIFTDDLTVEEIIDNLIEKLREVIK